MFTALRAQCTHFLFWSFCDCVLWIIINEIELNICNIFFISTMPDVRTLSAAGTSADGVMTVLIHGMYCLTHLSLDKMAAISQKTLSDAFWWMENFYFDSNFTEVCSQGSNKHWGSTESGNGLAPYRRQAITWINADPVHRRIYAALGGYLLRNYMNANIVTSYMPWLHRFWKGGRYLRIYFVHPDVVFKFYNLSRSYFMKIH